MLFRFSQKMTNSVESMCLKLFPLRVRSQGVTPGGVAESVSNKCEVVYIKERNLDDYISKTAKLEGNIYIINIPEHIKFGQEN